jgi:diaminohydroxyphosphoribosylaminopyrimidine deaminase/5-amino-6-(5-phosphoribosylamino)uracil reductase
MSHQLNTLDDLFMMECLALAQKGGGEVSPNPMVGVVITKAGRVVSRGYHKKFGGPHAEVNAIGAAKGSLAGATLYTNVEPCNFYGKTPPCTKLIIASGISHVVVGMRDPNLRVAGGGIRELRAAGIEVRTGVLEEESRKLNEAFTKFITTRTPFITLKVAQTLNGKIADPTGASRWITGSESRRLVHELRSRYDAVLVGAGTVNSDNPRLTVRNVKGRNPIRIIVDGNLSADPKSRVFVRSRIRTILFCSKESIRQRDRKVSILRNNGVEVIALSSRRDEWISMKRIFRTLGRMGIASVLVEGGARIFSSVLRERQADKLLVFVAPKIFGNGLDAFHSEELRAAQHRIDLHRLSTRTIGNDVLIEAYLHK